MAFPNHIFKAYDIRGIYPEELSEDLAYRTARWFADMRSRECNKQTGLTLVVGRDMRLSSPLIAEAVKRGFVEQGAQVIDVGLVSSPTFYFGVAKYGNDGGIMVSASHNPKEYSGLKLVRDHAIPVSKESGIDAICELVASGKLPEPFGSPGHVQEQTGLTEAAAQEALAYVGFVAYPKLKVVIDTANCMGALDMEALFALLPCELVRMNWELDGSFPSHEPDPYKEENLRDLQAKVKAAGADVGIALDGDADRIFFVTEKGETAPPIIMRTLFCQMLLARNPGAAVVYDVRPGKITEEVIRAGGGTPVVVRVGHSFIKEKMIETGAVFAGEASGHTFVRFPYGVFESPMVVTLMLLAQLESSGMLFSQLVAPFEKYIHSGEINFKVKDVAESLEVITKYFSSQAQATHIDGVSFDLGDVWFNVRGSNTEPLLRLNVEGKSREVVDAIVREVEGHLVR